MTQHTTGTRQEWLAARLKLLKAEKELTRRSDVLATVAGSRWPRAASREVHSSSGHLRTAFNTFGRRTANATRG